MKITVGMATYRDFDGVYFSLAAFRLYQSCPYPVELLVVDSFGEENPDGTGCAATKKATLDLGARYVHAPHAKGTSAPRNLVFEEATGDVVVCVDCHVLLESGFVARLAEFYRDPSHAKDMVQGPLLADDRKTLSTHFDPVWRKRMWGVWATDERVTGGTPFEIGMQGLGAFAMRKAAWPGFHKAFRGFGGEEGYIHEKVRRLGGKCYCHPDLRWMHRFGRPGGIPYPMRVADRIFNYLVGRDELEMSADDVLDHFNSHGDTVAVAEAVRDFEKYKGVDAVPLNPLQGWPQPSALDFAVEIVPPPPAPPPPPPPPPAAGVPAGPPAVSVPELVSCLCPTFGRGGTPGQLLLEEAVESFLRQSYRHKELIVLNDDPTQEFTTQADRVTVINLPRRFPTLGEKMNFLASMAQGSLLFVWDDDDISLPWRLELSRELIGGADYLNPRREWMLARGKLTHTHPAGNCFHASAFTRQAYNALRGFAHNSKDFDQDADARLTALGREGRVVTASAELPLARWWYVYRWGVSDHLSAGADADAKYARRALVERPGGVFPLRPKWQSDYARLVGQAAG